MGNGVVPKTSESLHIFTLLTAQDNFVEDVRTYTDVHGRWHIHTHKHTKPTVEVLHIVTQRYNISFHFYGNCFLLTPSWIANKIQSSLSQNNHEKCVWDPTHSRVFFLRWGYILECLVANWIVIKRVWGGADKYLAQPGRKQAPVIKLGIYSIYSPWISIHFLAHCSYFCKPLKKIQKFVHQTRFISVSHSAVLTYQN